MPQTRYRGVSNPEFGRALSDWARKLRQATFFPDVASLRDYLITFVTEFLILGAGLVVIKLAAAYWDTDRFGDYILARKTISLIQFPVVIGMSMAVTRHVAIVRRDRTSAGRYLLAATCIVLATSALACGVFNLFPDFFASLLLGMGGSARLVRSMSLAVAGLALHTVAYAQLRGRVSMGRANALQGINLGAAPLVIFLIPGLTVAAFVTLLGLIWLATSAGALGLLMLNIPMEAWQLRELRRYGRDLLRYGIPRVPGDFALGALFTLPITFTAHWGGPTLAGFLGLATSAVGLTGAFFAPFGQIALPAASGMFAEGRVSDLRRETYRLLLFCLSCTTLIVGVLEAFTPQLLSWYVGAAFLPAVKTVRILAIAAIPYVVYIVLRYILDAVSVRAFNAKNLLITLSAFLVLALVGRRVSWVPLALVASLTLLGLLTALDFRRVLRNLGE